jgi:hypothetical protein
MGVHHAATSAGVFGPQTWAKSFVALRGRQRSASARLSIVVAVALALARRVTNLHRAQGRASFPPRLAVPIPAAAP